MLASWKMILGLILLISNPGWAHQQSHHHPIFPDNTSYIGPNEKLNRSSIDEAAFNQVASTLNSLYANDIAKKNGVFSLKADWNNGTVNAYARRLEDYNTQQEIYEVVVYGGVARHPAMTTDGLALVICHEIGHHLGGQPKNSGNWGSLNWSSVEGQADYYAVTKCIRRVFAGDDNVALMNAVAVPAVVKSKCNNSFSNNADSALCMRSAMAGWSVLSVFADLVALPKPLDFLTPDRGVVAKTFTGHPALQCRLDTYLAGSICQVNQSIEFSDNNDKDGACMGNEIGSRPSCWYASKVNSTFPL